jgi:hypothetical protein
VRFHFWQRMPLTAEQPTFRKVESALKKLAEKSPGTRQDAGECLNLGVRPYERFLHCI